MELITGVHGKPHVTSTQHRAIYEMVIGKGSYILDSGELLESELQSNNTLKIRSGMLAHHGSISEVKKNTYDSVAINNGTQGMKRIDLVVARYTKNPETEVETMTWTVIQGTPAASNPVAPACISGNMQNGDLKDDCPLFEVHLNGIQVVEIKKLLTVLSGSLAELNSNLKNGFSELSAAQNGIFEHPSGLLVQWGNYPSNAMGSDGNVSGGYKVDITFKKQFAEPPQVFTSCAYRGGNTQTGTLAVSANAVTLYSQASVSGLYVGWLAIGARKL